MQFSQTTDVPQLYLASGAGSPASGTLLYLLPQNAASTPTPISFADSWNKFSGTYIFLEEPLAIGNAVFAAAAWSFLANTRQQGVRFAWINTPDGTNPLTGTTIAAYQTGQSGGNPTYATGYPVTFPFQSVTLSMTSKTAITVDDTNFAFGFTQQSTPAIYLSAQFGKVKIYGDGNGITSSMTLPLAGNLAGCLQFELELTQQNLTDLDVGLRYFFAVPPELRSPASTPQDGSFDLASLRYPIFNQGLTLYANLDPLAALDASRTFFAFNAADAGQASIAAAAAVPSYFNATMGDAFTLQPLTGSAAPTAFSALVFATNQQASAPTAHDPFYLVPRGDFALQVARSGTVNLMCGLSGVEYVELGTGTNIVSFFPGNNAFAAGYFPGQKPGYTNLQPSVAPTTAFAAVTQQQSGQTGTLDYYAQPDQSVLYNYNAQSPSGVTIPALASVPVLAGTINQAPASSLVYPLLPYSGLAGQSLAAYQQMESQIVSPVRRTALLAAPPVAQQSQPFPSRYSATPQGLLATYTPDSPLIWDQIILAKMTATPEQFRLSSVQGNLLSAFQSNKLFLVVSKPAAIQDSLFGPNAQISIGDDPSELWNFNLDPTPNPQTGQSPWATYNTIFIVKFSDLSISELAGQPSAWAFADYFNDSPATTSQTIAGIINTAAESNDADFAAFLNAVNNPNWNGILALNVMAPLSSLPPELAGLAAGIDPDLFFAHHIGINTSKINVPETPGDLSISDSSIFGLINYQAPGPLPPGGADYQYEVEQLKVLFLNSAVASFSSIIDLEVNNLFGESAKLAGSAENIVRMYGVYQQHVVNGQTLDSYLFQTASGQVSIFYLQSNVLNAVQFSKGQFVTIRPQPIDIASNGAVRTNGVTTITTTVPHQLNVGDSVNISGVTDSSFTGLFAVASVPSPTTFTFAQTGQPNASSGGGEILATETYAQFVFWGVMDFKSLPGFDLFSFGRPTSFIATTANKGAVRAGGVATITTTAPHGLTVGERVEVYGVADKSFNGFFTIASVPSATAFTYQQQQQPDSTSGNGAAAPDEVTGLSFGNLAIDLNFDSAVTPIAPVFVFDASQLSFDLASSKSRAGSFFTNFPLTVAGFTQAKQGTSPTGAGYMGLQSPLTLSALTYPWYSLNFNLNLGSPGALASQAGFIAGLTAAWSPGGNTYKAFTGLKLPGSNGSKREITIEGIFNITFKTLEILVQENNQYILVLYNIGFKFLAFTFPPSGQVNFVLFGDPNGAADGNTSLGWYAAYAKDAKPPAKKNGTTNPAGLPPAPANALPAPKEVV
ncbi:MAG TPA: hypothetical protein VGB07_23575 [Blastocatellia bacterium]